MASAESNILHQLYLPLDRQDEPWSMQLGIAVVGTLDEERLRDASLGAATRGDQLFLCLRYRHALFDADAAAEFTTALHDVLTHP
jgi:hypothetical protein